MPPSPTSRIDAHAAARDGNAVDTGALLFDVTRCIRPYLDDPTVQEIRLNPDGRLWIARAGEGKRLTDTVVSARDAIALLRFVATESKKTLTADKASLSGTLPHWHARVQGVIPPLVDSPAFTVRKRSTAIYTLDDYVQQQVITEAQRDALAEAVVSRQNILVGGGTFTGKTTFGNALLAVVASTGHRIYIAEDERELQCSAPDVISVLTDPLTYDTRRAILDALRHSPDRIIVGELRDGGTALELLKAWNTGHRGGIATLHANDTRGMLHRFCQLVEERVYPAPRDYVAEAVNVCVHMTLDARSPAGRRLSGLDVVRGYDPDRGGWLLEPLCA
jgi:type IV secretion system protein TrbB